jgi:hypothetical protein
MERTDRRVPGETCVELWRQGDGTWRWTFRSPKEGLSLPSNESYLSREEAVRSAGIAYPTVPLRERPPEPGWSLHPSLRWLARMLGAVAVVAVALVVALAGGAAAVLIGRNELRFRRGGSSR